MYRLLLIPAFDPNNPKPLFYHWNDRIKVGVRYTTQTSVRDSSAQFYPLSFGEITFGLAIHFLFDYLLIIIIFSVRLKRASVQTVKNRSGHWVRSGRGWIWIWWWHRIFRRFEGKGQRFILYTISIYKFDNSCIFFRRRLFPIWKRIGRRWPDTVGRLFCKGFSRLVTKSAFDCHHLIRMTESMFVVDFCFFL